MSQQNDSEQPDLFPTLLAPDSLVRIFPKPESKPASPDRALVYGPSALVYLGKFDPITQSLKTSQRCLVATAGDGFSEFCSTFPRSGIMRSGTVYELPPLAPSITAIGSGLFATPTAKGNQLAPSMQKNPGCRKIFPTPRASDYKDSGPVGSKSHKHMYDRFYLCAILKDSSMPAGKLNPNWLEWLMGYPIGHTELKQ